MLDATGRNEDSLRYMQKFERPAPEEQPREMIPWTIQQTFLVILLTFVARVLLSLLLAGGGDTTKITSPLPLPVDLTNGIISLLLTAFLQSLFLIGPIFVAMRAYQAMSHRVRLSWRTLGFRHFKVAQALGLVVLLYLGVYAINVAYSYLIDTFKLPLQTNDQVFFQMAKYAPITVYLLLFASVVLAPICEEVFFRSFVFMGFTRAMPLGWAMIFSSLIFAVAHGDIGSFIVLFFIGLALAFLRWHTGSVFPGMLLHLLNNTVASLSIILPLLGIIHR